MNRQLMNRLEQLEQAQADGRRATMFYFEGESKDAALATYVADHPAGREARIDCIQVRWLKPEEENPG